MGAGHNKEVEKSAPYNVTPPYLEEADEKYRQSGGAVVEVVVDSSRSRGSEAYHALLKEIGDLHDKKQQDYGRTGDPFSNVRASEEWGVQPWQGAMIRATDKLRRLQKFASTGKLANESVEDAFMDLAVYSLIACVLFREGKDKSTENLFHY